VTLVNRKGTILLPKLRTGTHEVTVTYSGTAAATASRHSRIMIAVPR